MASDRRAVGALLGFPVLTTTEFFGVGKVLNVRLPVADTTATSAVSLPVADINP